MKRPPPPSREFLDFLASYIEKLVYAVTRSQELSPAFLSGAKEVQLESERHIRKIAKRAARLASESARDGGYSEREWGDMSIETRMSILKEAITKARQSYLEADDIEPEKNRSAS